MRGRNTTQLTGRGERRQKTGEKTKTGIINVFWQINIFLSFSIIAYMVVCFVIQRTNLGVSHYNATLSPHTKRFYCEITSFSVWCVKKKKRKNRKRVICFRAMKRHHQRRGNKRDNNTAVVLILQKWGTNSWRWQTGSKKKKPLSTYICSLLLHSLTEGIFFFFKENERGNIFNYRAQVVNGKCENAPIQTDSVK